MKTARVSMAADMPEWADANMNLYLGYDPKGNQIGVSQQDH